MRPFLCSGQVSLAGRDDAQIIAALADANQMRIERARIKRGLRSGELSLAQVFAQRPRALRRMPLFELIGLLPGIGPQRADQIGRHALTDGVNLMRTVGDASERSLRWLLSEIDPEIDAGVVEVAAVGEIDADADQAAVVGVVA